MKRLFAIASLIFLFLLFPRSSHNEELNTDFLFEGEPEGPMKRREEEKKGEVLKIEDMVLVKGGCFDMGDTFGDGGSAERPVHQVCLDDFYIGEHEVTQREWQEIMGNNPSYLLFKGCDDCPVGLVSWNDIQGFIERFNKKRGKNYRLPTEAEWEYAARSGGKKERYSGTSSESEFGEYAWYGASSLFGNIRPVKQKRPNGLGLYDMSGNVWEWVSDWYDEGYYKNSPKDNPKGPTSGQHRVLRGGSGRGGPRLIRVAFRNWDGPDVRLSDYGFRLALSPSVR